VIKNRFIGRFSVSLKIINDKPSTILDIMRSIIVLRAEANLMTSKIDYVGISALYFDPVPFGEIAPEYEFIVGDGDPVCNKVK